MDLPRVLREIIRNLLLAERGLDLVGETTADVDLAQLVDATRADVVIMSLPGTALPHDAARVLTSHPGVRLLGVVDDGRDAVMHELRPHRRSLGNVSPTALVAALRGGDTAGDPPPMRPEAR